MANEIVLPTHALARTENSAFALKAGTPYYMR